MEKLILNDGSEIEILEGGSTGSITTKLENYAEIEKLAKKLTKESLSKIKFASGDEVTGEYTDMILEEPNFKLTQKEGYVLAEYGIREMTMEELQQESVNTAIAYLTDEQALTVTDLYAGWVQGKDYKKGDRRRYRGILYKCIQDHTSQGNWTPETAQSLWAKILAPDKETIAKWEQPGSTNGYGKGDKVLHNENTWESMVDNNVWEPGANGTENMWKKMTE